MRKLAAHAYNTKAALPPRITVIQSHASPTQLDSWSSRAASWAQVLMLALVGFGYFYTVRPIYQKDLLEEETARLQIEALSLRSNNERAARALVLAKNELNSVEKQRSALLRDNGILQSSNKTKVAEAERLRLQTDDLLGHLERAKVITSAQDRQIYENQLALLSQVSLTPLHDIFNRTARGHPLLGGDARSLDDFANQPSFQPYDLLLASIDKELSEKSYYGLPEPHHVSRALIINLRGKIVAARSELTCPIADHRAWVKALDAAKQANLASVPDCVEMHAKRTAKDEGWNPSQLARWRRGAQGQVYLAGHESACKSMADYHAKDLLWDKWQEFFGPCQERLIYAQSIASGKKPALKVIGSPNPPSPDPAWYAGWYRD